MEPFMSQKIVNMTFYTDRYVQNCNILTSAELSK